jgi:hypothetical protein
LTNWFGTSVHFNDIRIIKNTVNAITNERSIIWVGKDNKKRYFRRRIFFGVLFEFGYEFPFDLFDENHRWYKRVRVEGYTFDVTPFKDRSIPSFRPRRL